MPWTVDDPPPPAQNWTEEERRRCVEAANAVLEEGGTEEEAVIACIAAAGKEKGTGMELEYKSLPQFTKEISDRTVVGIFAVHGNVDEGGDRSWPGAFSNITIDGRNRVRFVWQHSMFDPPIAAINYIKEVPKSALPKKVLAYAPDATGGTEVSRTYLETDRGDEVLEGIKAGAIDEMSYSYEATKVDFEEVDGKHIRNLREVNLYDISDVLWGMNPATAGIKRWLPDGLRFQDHSDAVLAAVQEYTERARAIHELRAKEGRVLSQANRNRIASLLDSLREVADDLEELLEATAPKADPTAVREQLAKWERLRAQMHGVR